MHLRARRSSTPGVTPAVGPLSKVNVTRLGNGGVRRTAEQAAVVLSDNVVLVGARNASTGMPDGKPFSKRSWIERSDIQDHHWQRPRISLTLNPAYTLPLTERQNRCT
jgi:hypothetical protein